MVLSAKKVIVISKLKTGFIKSWPISFFVFEIKKRVYMKIEYAIL